MNRAVRILVFVIAAACLAGTSLASGSREVDRLWNTRFAGRLPEYCKYTRRLPEERDASPLFGTPAAERFARMFGSAWSHMHHYCWGLWEMYKALESGDNDMMRRSLYNQAIQNFDYVLIRSPDDMVLKPEIYFQKGVALLSLDQPLDAIDNFYAAIELKNDYVPAYVALADYFLRLGDREEAALILKAAIEQVPNSELLLQRLAKVRSGVPASE